MNYETLPAYQSLNAFTEDQWKLSPRALLDAFGDALLESQLLRLEELLRAIHRAYTLSSVQAGAVFAYLRVVLFEENTDETRAEALGHFLDILKKEDAAAVPDREYKRLCIKLLLPAIYDLNTWKPIANRLYFMQPRSGLNETFRYLFRRLEREGEYTPVLYMLHRDSVTTMEYFVNAAFFVRDITDGKALFVHESNDLLGYVRFRPETKVVQLWHGCGVFKHIGLSTAGKKGYKSLAAYKEFPEYNKYSLVTIASPELSWVFEEFMGIPKDSAIIQPLGVCRTDECYDDGYKEKCFRKLYEAIPAAKGKKVILYAPTYRGLGKNRVSPDALDVEQFAKALSDDYILILKHHQTARDLPEIPESCRESFAYDMTRGRGMNINELMAVADICITDYSSVAFEFSVYERPLLFFVFDIDDYIDNRGLYYDFNEITPGPLCRTNEEMIDYILHIDERFDRAVVTDFKNRFMCSCDGHACERTMTFLDYNHVYYCGGKAALRPEYADQAVEDDTTAFSGEAELKGENRAVLHLSKKEPAVRVRTAQPIPSELTLMPNPFERRGFRFAGWNLFQYEGDTIYWKCTDGTWHTKQEISRKQLKKQLYRDQESIRGLTMRNANPAFFSAKWKIACFSGFFQ